MPRSYSMQFSWTRKARAPGSFSNNPRQESHASVVALLPYLKILKTKVRLSWVEGDFLSLFCKLYPQMWRQ